MPTKGPPDTLASAIIRTGRLAIYTDGAGVKEAPGPGGWGAILMSDGQRLEMWGGVADTDNNRMEMTAAIEALRYAQRFSAICAMTIHTDSRVLVEGMTKLVSLWRTVGWTKPMKGAGGGRQPVANRDLWEVLAALPGRITWEWVRSHADSAHNCRADHLAARGMKKATVALRELRGCNIQTPHVTERMA